MNLSSTKNKIKEQFKSPGFFKRVQMLRNARKSGIILSNKDIGELFPDIETHSGYTQLIIKAKKAGIIKPETVISEFFAIRKSTDISLSALVTPLINAKKKGIDINPKDLIKLYRDGRPVPKIIKTLITLAKNDVELKIDDIETIFYSNKKFGEKIISIYAKTKKQYPIINAAQFKSLILSNIDPNEFYKVVELLKKKEIDIPFNILSELLKRRINILKTIILLDEAKKSCITELSKYNDMFSEKEIAKLSNIYVVEGKEKFKKELSMSLLNAQIVKDPVSLYFKLTRSEGKGFKVTLDTLNDFLGFEYNADIGKVTNSYLNARQNNLHIKYQQIAKLAQENIDVEQFIDAQIKSGADE